MDTIDKIIFTLDNLFSPDTSPLPLSLSISSSGGGGSKLSWRVKPVPFGACCLESIVSTVLETRTGPSSGMCCWEASIVPFPNSFSCSLFYQTFYEQTIVAKLRIILSWYCWNDSKMNLITQKLTHNGTIFTVSFATRVLASCVFWRFFLLSFSFALRFFFSSSILLINSSAHISKNICGFE